MGPLALLLGIASFSCLCFSVSDVIFHQWLSAVVFAFGSFGFFILAVNVLLAKTTDGDWIEE